MKSFTSLIQNEQHKNKKESENQLDYVDAIDFAKRSQNLSYQDSYAYLKRILTSKNEFHLICKGSQLGFTCAMLNITIMKLLHGCSSLYILPQEAAISDFSQARFNTIIKDSSLAADANVDNVHLKVLRGTALYLRGAGSREKLKEIPVRFLILDERDDMQQEMVALARERLTGSLETQEFDLSTPRLPDTGIYKEFKLCDQYRYFLACPFCSCSQMLDLEANLNLEQGFFYCQKCKKQWTHEQKLEMLKNGQWQMTSKGNGLVGDHISQLYSPTVTAKKIQQNWQLAQGDEALLQVFYNSKLGLPYEAKGSRLTSELFDSRVGIAKLSGNYVMGIDVSVASPHYVVLCQDTDCGLIVERTFRATWQELSRLIHTYKPSSYVIDAQPETSQSKKLVKDWQTGYYCYYTRSDKTITIDEESHKVSANRTEFLDRVFTRFNQDRILVSSNCEHLQELKSHLKAMVRCYRVVRGIVEAYYTETDADHFCHALVYAEIAASIPGQNVYEIDQQEKFC